VDFDWRGLEAAIRAQITGFVRQMRTEHPDDTLYGAAVHEFYAEAGGVIMWTLVGVASEETVDDDRVRWSPADWEWQLDPTEADEEWARRLTAAATARAALSSPHAAIRRHAEATLLQSELI